MVNLREMLPRPLLDWCDDNSVDINEVRVSDLDLLVQCFRELGYND